MRRFLGILVGATILAMPLTVSGHHYLKHQFFVYCGQSTNYMIDAHVVLSYDGGWQDGQTGGPHGDITFVVPGEVTEANLVVEFPGYCTYDKPIQLDSRPRKGGRGYWIDIYPLPCQPAPER